MTWQPPWRAKAIVTLSVALCLGCSGAARPAVSAGDAGLGEASTSSGLPRASTLPSLTAAQGAQLCDWANQVLGGYGRTVACPAGPRATDRDQAYCISGLPSCPTLTVADIEDCSLAQGADICQYFTANACAALRACAFAE
jgi:hypothetical protein